MMPEWYSPYVGYPFRKDGRTSPKRTIRPSHSRWWIPRTHPSLSDKTHRSYKNVLLLWRAALARLMDHPSARGNWIGSAFPSKPCYHFVNWRSRPTKESIQSTFSSRGIRECYTPRSEIQIGFTYPYINPRFSIQEELKEKTCFHGRLTWKSHPGHSTPLFFGDGLSQVLFLIRIPVKRLIL